MPTIIKLKPETPWQTPSWLALISQLPFEVYMANTPHHQPPMLITLESISGSSLHPLTQWIDHTLTIEQQWPLISRHVHTNHAFTYQSQTFHQDSFHIFAGLNAADNLDNTRHVFQILQEHQITTTRLGAFKPRTNPYTFQGMGETCLQASFELAGEYGIKIIAIEVLEKMHIDMIDQALERAGRPTGVMLQIGTRNAQNFELLKALGQQHTYPILYKRGYGITLEESLTAAEYIAQGGNQNIIFCLRGMKSLFAYPYRNLVDFSYVPAVKTLTRLPVCVDPSHAIGVHFEDPAHINHLFHATAQGIIAGANMLLLDFHPNPNQAKVDKQQTLSLDMLPYLLEDIQISREAYLKRQNLVKKFRT